MGISTQILGLIVSISFLVIIHELGHYTFARIFHTRVDKFYMFFNPYFSIVRFKKVNGKMRFKFFSRNTPDPLKKMMREDGTPALDEKGKQLYEPMTQADLDALPDDDWRKYPGTTEWGIGWIPFGGYCAINGMIDETTRPGELPAEPQPYEFRSKPAWQRLFIIIGGVLVNFVAALILYVAIVLGNTVGCGIARRSVDRIGFYRMADADVQLNYINYSQILPVRISPSHGSLLHVGRGDDHVSDTQSAPGSRGQSQGVDTIIICDEDQRSLIYLFHNHSLRSIYSEFTEIPRSRPRFSSQYPVLRYE